MQPQAGVGWLGIVRLGLVQASLGAIVVLTTSTLNRVMVVELALPALLPGLLVAWHYLVQFARPKVGHGSDRSGRRTPWIVGGLATLALGGWLAALATAWMHDARDLGVALAVLAFSLIGLGVAACGTSLLVLMAQIVGERRRAAAATTVWMMMIAGFILTSALAGAALEPYSPQRLVLVSGIVSLAALGVGLAAIRGLEAAALARSTAERQGGDVQGRVAARFRQALASVWSEAPARRFTVFIFASMLAYSAQDLILEPFAGIRFGYSPGASTRLSAVHHGGVLAGMLLVAAAGSGWLGRAAADLRAWMIGGCIASGLALFGLASGAAQAGDWPLRTNVFALGLANGAFSIAAIASMMCLVKQGHAGHEGTRMGMWGAAQAVSFGFGGLIGAAASDLARWAIGDVGLAYASVFALEGALFLVSAAVAARIEPAAPRRAVHAQPDFAMGRLSEGTSR
jgi:BCD family chlorophyll transporter-like MFS transporter